MKKSVELKKFMRDFMAYALNATRPLEYRAKNKVQEAVKRAGK